MEAIPRAFQQDGYLDPSHGDEQVNVGLPSDGVEHGTVEQVHKLEWRLVRSATRLRRHHRRAAHQEYHERAVHPLLLAPVGLEYGHLGLEKLLTKRDLQDHLPGQQPRRIHG